MGVVTHRPQVSPAPVETAPGPTAPSAEPGNQFALGQLAGGADATSGHPILDQVGGGLAQHVAPRVIDNGMIIRRTSVTLEGHDVTLAAGTYVEVLSPAGDPSRVRAWSGHHGAEGDIDRDLIRPETEIDRDAHTHNPDERVTYGQIRGRLWDGAPRAADIHQGFIGDCYLMAAMDAVVGRDPARIQAMFSPTDNLQADRYNVTVYKPDSGGIWQPQTRGIDNNFPIRGGEAAYAAPDRRHPALWPLFLEKAVAQVGFDRFNDDGTTTSVQGYDAIGSGGASGWAMQVLLGQTGTSDVNQSANPLDHHTTNVFDLGGPQFLHRLAQWLGEGTPVVFNTPTPPGSQGGPIDEHARTVDAGDPALAHVYGNHAYALESVDEVRGTLTLRNPWGRDGGTDRQHGIVVLTAAQAQNQTHFASVSHTLTPMAATGPARTPTVEEWSARAHAMSTTELMNFFATGTHPSPPGSAETRGEIAVQSELRSRAPRLQVTVSRSDSTLMNPTMSIRGTARGHSVDSERADVPDRGNHQYFLDLNTLVPLESAGPQTMGAFDIVATEIGVMSDSERVRLSFAPPYAPATASRGAWTLAVTVVP
jgi:hypothetical protein